MTAEWREDGAWSGRLVLDNGQVLAQAARDALAQAGARTVTLGGPKR